MGKRVGIKNHFWDPVLPTKGLLTQIWYFNRPFDKKRLKLLLKWTLADHGQKKTIDVVETLKNVGYSSATHAGLSLSVDDLIIPSEKKNLLITAETNLEQTNNQVLKGYLTSVEYLAQIIDTWNATSELIKEEVIKNFHLKDVLNPVYMMAFSGARGNISQVRQLVGMRGLMADPNGNIIDFPIQSNFREGLTLTEYVISCYGARKGVVDTALRTATSGYLTRRLVDVAQHVVVRVYDCGTKKGIYLSDLTSNDQTILDLQTRLVGRVLAEDVYESNKKTLIAHRNTEITDLLSQQLIQHHKRILVRSSLTCIDKKYVCQLCYGWSLSGNRLVSIGETVGIIAAQSIGEPGTQLTMRTFHTGGVFSGEVSQTVKSPAFGQVYFLNSIAGKCVRTTHGEIAFLTKQSGVLFINEHIYPSTHLALPEFSNSQKKKDGIHELFLKPYSLLFVKQGQIVYKDQILAEASSLSKLSLKSSNYHTIYANFEGEIKFRNTQVVKNLYYPNYTKNTQLSGQIGEFWILSAQKQTFFQPFTMFIEQGDFFESTSPLVFYYLFTTLFIQIQKKQIQSSLLHNSLSIYKNRTFFYYLNKYKFVGSYDNSQNWIKRPIKLREIDINSEEINSTQINSPSFSQLAVISESENKDRMSFFFKRFNQFDRGQFIERALPFFSMIPKNRLKLWFKKGKNYFNFEKKLKKFQQNGYILLNYAQKWSRLYKPFDYQYPYFNSQKKQQLLWSGLVLLNSFPFFLIKRTKNQVDLKKKRLNEKKISQNFQDKLLNSENQQSNSQVTQFSFNNPFRQNDTNKVTWNFEHWNQVDKKMLLTLYLYTKNITFLSKWYPYKEIDSRYRLEFFLNEPLWSFYSLQPKNKLIKRVMFGLNFDPFLDMMGLSLLNSAFSPKKIENKKLVSSKLKQKTKKVKTTKLQLISGEFPLPQSYLNNFFNHRICFRFRFQSLYQKSFLKTMVAVNKTKPHFDYWTLKIEDEPPIRFLYAPRKKTMTRMVQEMLHQTSNYFCLQLSFMFEQKFKNDETRFVTPPLEDFPFTSEYFKQLRKEQLFYINKSTFQLNRPYLFHQMLKLPFCFEKNKKKTKIIQNQPTTKSYEPVSYTHLTLPTIPLV